MADVSKFTVLRTVPDKTRERLASELEDAARRVRAMKGHPSAIGIIVVEPGVGESNDVYMHTRFEGRDLLRLMAGCTMLARRIDESMAVEDDPDMEPVPTPEPEGDGDD